MKKILRIMSVTLALCLSIVLTPTASAITTAHNITLNPGQTVTASTISTTKKTEEMVWIPTHGGKKYHSKSSCSGMKEPEKVTLSEAKKQGYTACKKCY